MHYVVVDLEATCWENTRTSDRSEIIEIGAIYMASAAGPVLDEFDRFVRPVNEPILSEFCRTLTSIRQADIDKANAFPDVLAEFLDWIGSEPFVLCSWGDYDYHQFRTECARHDVEFPESFHRHINLKQGYTQVYAKRSRGVLEALAHIGLSFQGTPHRGIDDARNTADLAQVILPQLEYAGLIDVS